jgi:hypothetical protein
VSDTTQDLISTWLTNAGHPAPERVVALKATVDLSDGSPGTLHLCQTSAGALLCATNGAVGRIIDLAEVWPLGWEDGVFNDALIVGNDRHVVPTGKAGEARLALGLGRIAARAEQPAVPVTGPGGAAPSGPWCDELEPTAAAFLARRLEDGDFVLVWLRCAGTTTFPNGPTPKLRVRWHLLVTRDLAAIVAVSPLGDTAWETLPAAPLLAESGADHLTMGERSIALERGASDRFMEVADLPAVTDVARLREAAWRLARHGGAGAELADRLLDRLIAREDPIDRLARAARQETVDDAVVSAAVLALPMAPEIGPALSAWFEHWAPANALADAVLDQLITRAEEPEDATTFLDFHRAVRMRRVRDGADLFTAAEGDIALAEHLLFAGARPEAQALLEARLRALPAEDLVAIAPPEGADLTAGEGAPSLHLRCLELLAHARGDGAQDTTALAALARHQPLVPARLAALVAELGKGDLSQRAQRALDILTGTALDTPGPAPTAGCTRALPDTLAPRLQHPAAREDGALGRVQAALANFDPPDATVVRSYCERLSEKRHEDAADAITDGAMLLGMPVPTAFISRGERDVGLRSHERPAPFLLLGGAHLDPDSDHHLAAAEMRFAIGAELAHLRFQHSRVTSSDVWAGVWDKTTTALSATVTLLPFLRFLPVEALGRERTVRALRTAMPDTWLRAVYQVEDSAELAARLGANPGKVAQSGADAVDTATGALTGLRAAANRLLPSDGEGDLNIEQARLVVAHRLMQLTADRVGLLLSGDLGAAIRAMFLTGTRLQPELRVACAQGLQTTLSRKDADGAPILPYLTIRCAALIAFWLSDEYATLRDAAMRPLLLGEAPAED